MADISSFKLTEVENLSTGDSLVESLNHELVDQIKVALSVDLGHIELSLAELKELKENSIVKLGFDVDSPFDLKWQDTIVAKGKLIAIDEKLGLEITEVTS
jgi:flagellar motor switch protein FliN/FliY